MDRIKGTIKSVVTRYNTADPFRIAEKLNIEVHWVPLGRMPLGKTIYDGDAPIVMLNYSIRDTPQRYFVMAHEVGHVILHEGLSGYYTGFYHGYDRLEREANQFAIGLMGMLYIEDNGRQPETMGELSREYGI